MTHASLHVGTTLQPTVVFCNFFTRFWRVRKQTRRQILSRHDSIQSIAVSCHVHMYAYICIYSCMHRLFLHMIYNRWDKPLDLYSALRRGLLASGTRGTGVLGVICLGWEACREKEGHSTVLPLCLFAVFCCRWDPKAQWLVMPLTYVALCMKAAHV